jgi:hypothetical protein
VAAKTKRARIRLLKHVIIEGKHTDKGSKLEMDRHKATELVSTGQAEFMDEADDEKDGRDLEDGEQMGVRIEHPTHGDPGVKHLDPKAGQRGGGNRGRGPAAGNPESGS